MMNKVRLFEAFAGYGSQLVALRELEEEWGEKFVIPVGYSEIDANAVLAHKKLHGDDVPNYGDISKIDWEKVPDFDLFTYSFPCFTAGTLVMTRQGYKKIEDVTADDEVITHTKQYQKVVKPMQRDYKGVVYNVRTMMAGDIQCTEEHPFYVRRRKRVGHEGIRTFLAPEWVKAKDLTKDYCLGFAINQESALPKWNGVEDNRWGHHNRTNKLSELFYNPLFWYLMGRYVGDGWCRGNEARKDTGAGIVICCGGRNEDILKIAIKQCGFHAVVSKDLTVTKYIIMMNELNEFVKRYGYYAYGKKIDIETLDLPVDLLEAFMDGILDSDGCYSQGLYKITSVSRELIYGLAQCIAKVYARPCSINFCKRPDTCVIGGRTVNQKDTWTVTFKKHKGIQDQAFYEDGYVWFPIREILSSQMECKVYNMEVENDNSYTANGAIVHNCQDISAAGLQRGFKAGGGTRSGLLWECCKAIKIKHPQWLLMENVKALISEKFMPDFLKWIDWLKSEGYSSEYMVLDAKDYGVPQHRERVFMVSYHGRPNPFRFPKPWPLTKTIQDVLEDEVDEKYYLKEETLKKFKFDEKFEKEIIEQITQEDQ